MIDEDDAASSTLTQEEKAAQLARAKATFDLVQRIRMNGAIRMHEAIAAHLKVAPKTLSFDRSKLLEKACSRADLSKGASYRQRKLVYGLSIYENDGAFRVAYLPLHGEA